MAIEAKRVLGVWRLWSGGRELLDRFGSSAGRSQHNAEVVVGAAVWIAIDDRLPQLHRIGIFRVALNGQYPEGHRHHAADERESATVAHQSVQSDQREDDDCGQWQVHAALGADFGGDRDKA